MRIIGHHTCSSKGNISDIEIQGPFFSEHDEEDSNAHKFLGSGYYFWDNNIGMAHSHGQNNYKRKYYIFEADLNLVEEALLDLAGNRIDMLHFQEIMKKLNEIDPNTESWTLAHFIEFLKSKNIFSYKAIRAIDTSITPRNLLKFVPERKNYINLSPIFIVCLLDNTKDIILSFNHIRTFPPNE
ncbi:hypothetical protein [Bernardetia sp. MNP-M8]|uniref:hypothetical protein n=1 Tax=Bernardetia sp. MNP-M8 TaxID=3127470 RepID=UPI0030CBC338